MSPDTADITTPPSDGLPAPSTPGAILAAQRDQVGLSIADVANKLKLSKRQIEALEADDYTVLPGNTFVRGFVRNYARLLELDPQPLLQFLDGHLPKEAAQAVLPRLRDEALPVLRPAGHGGRQSFFSALLLGLGIALLIGGGVFWFLTQRGGFNAELMLSQPEPSNAIVEMPAPVAAVEPELITPTDAAATPVATDAGVSGTTVTAVPDPSSTPTPTPAAPLPIEPVSQPAVVATPAPLAAKPASSVTTPVPSVVPAPSAGAAKPATEPVPAATSAAAPATQGEVRVVAKQDSWVQVIDGSGKRLINELLPAGAVRAVSGTAPYKVRIGNGHNTALYYKGKATDLTPHIKVDVANLELN